MSNFKQKHQGSSLIEVMVAMLILSLGMLSLGAMLSFSIQMPKLSGYRATASNLASSHIEKIRANSDGFITNSYEAPLSYDGTTSVLLLDDCIYPDCDVLTLARMDTAAAKKTIRTELPSGGMILKCDPSPCTDVSNSYGNIWIIWKEPRNNSPLGSGNSDNCPPEVTVAFADPKPRCLYVRFKI